MLFVYVPRSERSIVSPDDAREIGAFVGRGRVVIVPTNDINPGGRPDLEISDSFLGLVCPDCMTETGWDNFEWLMFLSGVDPSSTAP